MRLKLVPPTQVDEMAEMLVAQDLRLRELEAKLSQEKAAIANLKNEKAHLENEKANLEIDFQHLIDQLKLIGSEAVAPRAGQFMVCG